MQKISRSALMLQGNTQVCVRMFRQCLQMTEVQ